MKANTMKMLYSTAWQFHTGEEGAEILQPEIAALEPGSLITPISAGVLFYRLKVGRMEWQVLL